MSEIRQGLHRYSKGKEKKIPDPFSPHTDIRILAAYYKHVPF